jgi:hypothetical protein
LAHKEQEIRKELSDLSAIRMFCGRFIPMFIVRRLVCRDLRLRAAGKRPDRWYWLDVEAVRRKVYIELPEWGEEIRVA